MHSNVIIGRVPVYGNRRTADAKSVMQTFFFCSPRWRSKTFILCFLVGAEFKYWRSKTTNSKVDELGNSSDGYIRIMSVR